MYKILITIACITISLIACQKKESYLLPENKMVDILTDLHIAEAAAINVEPGVKDSLTAVYEAQIFKNHKVDKQDFIKCLKQYQKEPKELERVYKLVIEKLDKKDI